MSDHLNSLYPFLKGDKKNAASENEALLESVRQKSNDSLSVKQAFFSKNAQALVDAASGVADVYRNGNKLFSMGNGGSSCDASHFAVEFQHPVTAGRPALPAYNLTIDTAFFSAVSNDVGVKHVFARQIEAHGRPGDGLVGFSTSGNSENLIAGFRKAKDLGLVTVGFAGGTGGEMKSSGLLDHCLIVDTDSIHRVQEVHVSCYHILWDLVHTLLADDRGKLGKAVGQGTPSQPEASPNKDKASETVQAKPAPAKKAPLQPTEVRHNLMDAKHQVWPKLLQPPFREYRFRQKQSVGGYITDFACLEPKLIVELDSSQNSDTRAQDQKRSHALEAEGFTVLRFWNNEALNNTDAVMTQILTTLESL